MASSPPIYCPLCGAVNVPDATSCVSCGHPLTATPSQHLLAPSALLRQRYRIVGLAGAGGFSTVYRAEDTQLHHRLVAVKEISQRQASPEDARQTREAFQREAALLAGLQHANLPRIDDAFEEGGRWYLVMEFIEGQTLEERLRRSPGQRLPVPEALEVGVQLATVLEYLHLCQPPVIFRDLKPANVMLTAPLHAYLIDFGIARLFKPGQHKDTRVMGTVGYLAPEGYGKGQTTPRSDIYSLGVTLHRLLSGVDPADKPFQVPPLHAPVPTALAALVAEMVEREEGRRPATMTLVKQRLQRMVAARAATPTDVLPGGAASLSTPLSPDQSRHPSPGAALGPQFVQTPPMPPPLQPRPRGVSRRTVALGLGLGALAVGAGVVGILQQGSQRGREVTTSTPPTQASFPATATPAPGLTPTPTPNTAGTVAYPPYRGQHGSISAVAWSPLDGRTIASCGDNTVRVWDSVTQHSVSNYLASTLTLAWSPDGKSIASIMNDPSINSIQVWDPETGQRILTYVRPQGALAQLSRRSGKTPMSGDGDIGWAVAWSPDSQRIASSLGFEGGIRIWRLSDQQNLLSFGTFMSFVTLAWSPDGQRLLSDAGSSTGAVVYIWDANTGKQLGSYSGHKYAVSSVKWSPNGQLIASASGDGTVRVWRPGGGTIFVYTGHTSYVMSLAWSPDSRRIASASEDTTVQLWDATTGAHAFVYRGHTQMVNTVAWSPDGKYLASGGNDETVQVWEAR